MERELFCPFNVLLLFCLNLALNVSCSQERPPHRNHTMLSTDTLISLTAFRKAVWTQILILGKKAYAENTQWLRLLAHTQLCSPHCTQFLAYHEGTNPSLCQTGKSTNSRFHLPLTHHVSAQKTGWKCVWGIIFLMDHRKMLGCTESSFLC